MSARRCSLFRHPYTDIWAKIQFSVQSTCLSVLYFLKVTRFSDKVAKFLALNPNRSLERIIYRVTSEAGRYRKNVNDG